MMQAPEHRVYTSEAEMMASYADRRRRLMSVKPKSVPKLIPVAPVRILTGAARPLWRRQAIFFSDHVTAWQMYKASLVMSPVPAFIVKWCTDHCTSVGEMTGHGRKREVAALRHMLIYDLYHGFHVSLPQLGRLFSGRDHTTILNSLRRAAEMKERGQA